MTSPSGYSKFVKITKLGLPIAGAFLLAIALAWPYLNDDEPEVKTVEIEKDHPSVIEQRMINPEYKSTDTKGQPFAVQAEWGKPLSKDEADLVTPKGTLTTEKHGDVRLDAKHGVYNKDTRELILDGDVTLDSDDGYHIVTQQANVDVENKAADGDVPIQGYGPTGLMKSENGFHIEQGKDGKRKITLKGKSHLTINSETLKGIKQQ